MCSLRLAVAEWLPHNLHESSASHVLNHLLLALLPLALALMCASSLLCMTHTLKLHHHWHSPAGVHAQKCVHEDHVAEGIPAPRGKRFEV
jgi:hypothetical protein